MKIKFLIFLIFISSLANAQTSRQRLEDIEDKLDMMRAEQDYRDAQRIIEQQNRELKDLTPIRPSTIIQNPIQNNSSKICYLLWNGESFNRLNSKHFNFFTIAIVDDAKLPFIEVYLPKSFEKNTTKLNSFIKRNIEIIKNSCK